MQRRKQEEWKNINEQRTPIKHILYPIVNFVWETLKLHKSFRANCCLCAGWGPAKGLERIKKMREKKIADSEEKERIYVYVNIPCCLQVSKS